MHIVVFSATTITLMLYACFVLHLTKLLVEDMSLFSDLLYTNSIIYSLTFSSLYVMMYVCVYAGCYINYQGIDTLSTSDLCIVQVILTMTFINVYCNKYFLCNCWLSFSMFSSFYMCVRMNDVHHCFKSGNIPKTEGSQIVQLLCGSLMISMKFN